MATWWPWIWPEKRLTFGHHGRTPLHPNLNSGPIAAFLSSVSCKETNGTINPGSNLQKDHHLRIEDELDDKVYAVERRSGNNHHQMSSTTTRSKNSKKFIKDMN